MAVNHRILSPARLPVPPLSRSTHHTIAGGWRSDFCHRARDGRICGPCAVSRELHRSRAHGTIRAHASLSRSVRMARRHRRRRARVAPRGESGHHSMSDHGSAAPRRDPRRTDGRDLPGMRQPGARRLRVVRERFADGLRVSPVPSARLARGRLGGVRYEVCGPGTAARGVAVDRAARRHAVRAQAGRARVDARVVERGDFVRR